MKAWKTTLERNRYYDSVFLMAVAHHLSDLEGMQEAAALMGSPANKEILIGMGVDPASIADASRITASLGPGTKFGAYIGKVRPGSACEKAGLEAHDIITEFNLHPIANANDLERQLARLHKGSHFSLVFLRGSNTVTAEGVL